MEKLAEIPIESISIAKDHIRVQSVDQKSIKELADSILAVGLTRAAAAWYDYTPPAAGRRASSGKVILFGGQRSDWSVSSQTYEYLPVGYTTPTPAGTPETTPTPIAEAAGIIDSGDYNGDGTSDIAIFRGSSGLWSVRGVTRAYFGTSGDIPAPGDYNGDGATDIGIFRIGLWAIRDLSRVYFGGSGDVAMRR